MCSETFLRLPEEKRLRFLNAAWEEFTRVKYADASINQVIRRAGIPRGSFYQYFTDKEDLFSYLLEDIQTQVIQVFGELLQQAGGDIFQIQLAIYDSITDRNRRKRPIVDRCFRILSINPGIDLQKIIARRLGQRIPPALMERIDVSRLARQDSEYVRRVFLLALGVLGRSMMDALLQPERTEEFRRELVENLKIIQYGSLARPDGQSYQGGDHETTNHCAAAGAGAADFAGCGVRAGG